MNALNSEVVPVKAELTSLAQLVRLWMKLGLTGTADLARETRKSERAIRKAKEQIAAFGHLHPERTFLPPGSIVPPPRNYDSAPGTVVPSDNLSHGENPCAQRTLYTDNTYRTEMIQSDQLVAASNNTITRARNDAGQPLPSSAGNQNDQGGASPPTPTPPPKVTLEMLVDRFAPMLPGDEKRADATEHVKNLLHAYDEQTISKALTRLKQRLLDGYEVKSFSRMLEALCGDVERDAAAKRPERPIPWGAIDLGNGQYVSRY